jgi:uncharacterized protein YidB (DUF937 family)
MGFFDSLKDAAADFAGQGAHEALGSVLQGTPLGGMSGMLDQLRQGGLGEQVESWCQGAMANVTPDQIKDALGDEHLQQIAASMGLSTDDLANHLAEHLPAMTQAHAQDQLASDDDAGAGADQ